MEMPEYENVPDEIELAKQVEGYQRRTKTGTVVTVRGYVRTDNSAVADRARQSPGRPSMAAASGRFPGDRAIPVWPDAGKGVRVPDKEEEEPQDPEYEDMPDTGEVDQDSLDKDVPIALEIMKGLPQNPSLRKLAGILKSLSTASLSDVEADPLDTIELATRVGQVRVKGYSYVNKQGKVVVVNPYSQMRRLLMAMGGPAMAAKRGVTPDLLDAAFPGYDMKAKLYKAKPEGRKQHRRSLAPSKRKAQDALVKINREVKIDREFDVSKPRPGEDYMKKAMSPTHPLEAVRSAQEGSQVHLGGRAWVRSGDGKWYSSPRRNDGGKTDRQITKEIASRGGYVQLHQAQPIERTKYERSQVNLDVIDVNSANYTDTVRYAKTLAPVMENLPDGVADSLNGHVVAKADKTSKANPSNMVGVQVTRTNKHYPKLTINPNPDFEKEVIKTIPKQQQQGYNVPTTLHPMETVMARESAHFLEELVNNRAPSDMTDRMYDRLSAAYDKRIKKDDKSNYVGLSGREGWLARLTGEMSEDLRGDIRDQVSLSALNSPEQFLAEAWTEFVGNPEPRPMARDIGYAFQKSMDEFSEYLRKNKWADATEIPEKTWQKSTQKSVGRNVSDAIGGATENTLEYNLAPRDLRSVLNHSSKYVDVRDGDGNPLFDAELVREGDTALIGAVSFPPANPEDMPEGVPNYIPTPVLQEKAKYFKTPITRLGASRENQQAYASFIDREKSLKSLEAVEETLFRQGVTRAEVDVTPGDTSILYARAGYGFDPNATDHMEIRNILESLKSRMDGMREDKNKGFYEIPKRSQNSINRNVNKWLKDLTEDPETWPTPQQIAKLGKLNAVQNSPGEDALMETAWSGVKILDGKGYDLDFDLPGDLPDPGDLPEIKQYIDAPAPAEVLKPTQQRASTVANVARAITPSADTEEALQTKLLKESIIDLGNSVLAKHREVFPDAKVNFSGKADNHRISIKNGKDTIFSMTAKIDGDDITLSGPTHARDNLASAFLAYEMLENLEDSYEQSGLKTLSRDTKKGEPVANYVLASSGYTWKNPPTREQLSDLLNRELEVQMAEARSVMETTAAWQNPNADTGTQFRMQQRVYREVEKMRQSLEGQINAYLQRYDTDPEGPTPFEIAQIGKEEAYKIDRAKSLLPPEAIETLNRRHRFNKNAPVVDVDTGEVVDPQFNVNAPKGAKTPSPEIPHELLPKLSKNATAAEIAQYNKILDKLERDLEYERRKQGTMLQQMMSLDGDATHDTFIEFLGKQALTMGAYGWYKSLGGWWDWASDTYNPSARKSTVSLIFMLLRLLPSGLTRGAMLTTTNMMVKKLKSPKPEDWPSPQEIEEVISDLSAKIPDNDLTKLLGDGF